MSWKMLEGLYRLTGDSRECRDRRGPCRHARGPAAGRGDARHRCSPTAISAPAEAIIRAFLLRHGDHPEAMRLLAKIGMARDVLDDAEILLEAVLALAPEHRAARYEYAQCLSQRHKYRAGARTDRAAAGSSSRAISTTASWRPRSRWVSANNDAAIALYRELLADAPEAPDVHLWLAHALKTVGQVPEAIDAYRAAAASRPDFGDAYWSLANLKTYRFADDGDRAACARRRRRRRHRPSDR